MLRIAMTAAVREHFAENPTHKEVQIHFMFTQEDLDKLEEIKKNNPECLYRVSDIEYENIGNVKDSGTRLGYYITV